jgi:DNA-binding MarR family transcriptional regulator
MAGYATWMVDGGPEHAQRTVELADELLLVIGGLRREVRRAAGRPWPESRLTGSQVELLGLIRRHPSVSIELAADEMGVDADYVAFLAQQLAGRGLVDRYTDTSDRRLVRLELTPAAHADVDIWRDHRALVVAQTLDECTVRERENFVEAARVLQLLIEKLHSRKVATVGTSPLGSEDERVGELPDAVD